MRAAELQPHAGHFHIITSASPPKSQILLSNLLIKPCQRVPRYVLLLGELLKHSVPPSVAKARQPLVKPGSPRVISVDAARALLPAAPAAPDSGEKATADSGHSSVNDLPHQPSVNPKFVERSLSSLAAEEDDTEEVRLQVLMFDFSRKVSYHSLSCDFFISSMSSRRGRFTGS